LIIPIYCDWKKYIDILVNNRDNIFIGGDLKMDISPLISELINYYNENSYSRSTIERTYTAALRMISADAKKFEKYTDMRSLIEAIDSKYRQEMNDATITRHKYYILHRALIMLAELAEGKKLSWRVYRDDKPSDLLPFYEQKFSDFKEAHQFTSAITKSCFLREFFLYLQDAGIKHFADAKSTDIKRFIELISNRLSQSSKDAVYYILRLAKSFFGDDFVPGFSFDPIIITTKQSSPKIYNPFKKSELFQLLNGIDTKIAVGLRDFAMILLGACLGLRAGDIANLKLNNFDWENKNIKLIQKNWKFTNFAF
jgi:integrase